ncbi:putative adhesin [Candidatus Entotheonella palauensis]|uniref:putative adhesin n=1 Tax=Candidatus Entotheonella palauensis TaxID=93172 RepID=UPI000B7EEEE1|nr:hypothetical protein [Candidatus Entotheonella palauensis]
MPTITVTSADMALMQCTDAVAKHLLIMAHGRPTNRAFTVPPGKTIRQYTPQALLKSALGSVESVMRGRLSPNVVAPAGHRLPDYTLIPVRGYASHSGATDHLYAALLRYVEQAGRQAGTPAPRDGLNLGPGVPCDILCLRPRRVSSWVTSRYPRLSQLAAEGLLAQYTHLHCLLSPAVRPASAVKK